MSAVAIAQRFANLVRLEHTVFALPYAYVGAILAVDGWPGISVLGWITVVMVGARSFAMAVNRLVDAAIDARNPRTAGRELPAGRLKRSQVIAFALASLAVFVIGISQLPAITRWLAPIVIVAMVVYPYLKRVTPLCHVWLGVVDGLAPVGGWVAVTGHFDIAAWLLGAAVACWIAGFDIIYATMDIEVDRAQGLHSLPADCGVARALYASRTLHALSVVALAAVGWSLGLGPIYAVGVVAVAALLAYEQQLVSPDDLSRVDMAFLSVNGVIALLYLGTVSLDVALS
jgi:4-hydroxybenzoate polyprenyltransferase